MYVWGLAAQGSTRREFGVTTRLGARGEVHQNAAKLNKTGGNQSKYRYLERPQKGERLGAESVVLFEILGF